MPSESLWVQYPIIGILVLTAGVIAAVFYRLWKDLLAWLETQDVKRNAEREKQRVWQAEQDIIRDERWQQFLQSMQEQWSEQDGRHTEALKQLVGKVDTLIVTVNNHDTWERARYRNDL